MCATDHPWDPETTRNPKLVGSAAFFTPRLEEISGPQPNLNFDGLPMFLRPRAARQSVARVRYALFREG